MQMSQYHYLPLAPGFFAILIGLFVIVLVLRSVRFAYESLGVSSATAMWLLFASLLGSIFNIPIARTAAGTGDVRPGDQFLRHAIRGAASSAISPAR